MLIVSGSSSLQHHGWSTLAPRTRMPVQPIPHATAAWFRLRYAPQLVCFPRSADLACPASGPTHANSTILDLTVCFTDLQTRKREKALSNRLQTTRRRVTFLSALTIASIGSLAAAASDDVNLSKSELKSLLANAETKSDHARIAQYFEAEAAKYDSQAKEHSELAAVAEKSPPSQPTKFPGSMQTFNHCSSMSKSLSEAAANARAIAAEHRKMAEQATK